MLCCWKKHGENCCQKPYFAVTSANTWPGCMVWLQKVSMAFVKEDHVLLPSWLPCIMNGLLFLVNSLHPEFMLCFLTGLKPLTWLVTACYCPNRYFMLSNMSNAQVVYLILTLIWDKYTLSLYGRIRGFSTVASFQAGPFSSLFIQRVPINIVHGKIADYLKSWPD